MNLFYSDWTKSQLIILAIDHYELYYDPEKQVIVIA